MLGVAIARRVIASRYCSVGVLKRFATPKFLHPCRRFSVDSANEPLPSSKRTFSKSLIKFVLISSLGVAVPIAYYLATRRDDDGKDVQTRLAPRERVVRFKYAKLPETLVVREVHTNSYAANAPIEDRHAELLHSPTEAYFGVYDGHSGTAAAEFAEEELIYFVRYHLYELRKAQRDFLRFVYGTSPQQQPRLRNYFAQLVRDPFSTDVYNEVRRDIERYLAHVRLQNPEAQKNIRIALESLNPDTIPDVFIAAFVDADMTFLNECILTENWSAGLSGACVILAALLSPRIYVAHGGDCRAVLGRRAYTSDASSSSADEKSSQWISQTLTLDHTTAHPEERKRLLSEHPDEPDVIARERIKGRLQPTRGLGDGLYKSPLFQNGLKTPRPNWHPPYTTAKPDVAIVDARETANGKVAFLVLATDGLWEQLDDKEVIDTVGKLIDSGLQKNAATELIMLALERASKRLSKHGVAVPNGRLDAIRTILDTPQSIKRAVHDDITVTVVFFNESGTKADAHVEMDADEVMMVRESDQRDAEAGTEIGPPVPLAKRRLERLVKEKASQQKGGESNEHK